MARQPQNDFIPRAAGSWLSLGDSPERCRQRRRRRIELRRERPNWSASPLPAVEEEAEESDAATVALADQEEVSHPPEGRISPNPMPDFSLISIEGVPPEIHVYGAVHVVEDFCNRPPANVFAGGEPLHFCAVYDGHASALYKRHMHGFIAEELARADISYGGDIDITAPARYSREWWNGKLLSALQRSFERLCRLAAGGSAGATAAMVAVLTAEHIVVARGGGSSRAVLCSDGISIPLSHDHRYDKPHDQMIPGVDETIHNDRDHNHNGLRGYEILEMPRLQEIPGSEEVMGSSSRGEPEIFIIERSKDEDECLIVGSDGVWDVISDETAFNVATTCLRDRRTFGQTMSNRSDGVDAAALLSRLALARGSDRSVSVIVVDFKA